MWRGWVRIERADDYVAYIERTGLAGYHGSPGSSQAAKWPPLSASPK